MIKNLKNRVMSYKKSKRSFLMLKARGKPLYAEYFFTGAEAIRYETLCLLLISFFSYFFYRSMLAILFLFPIGIYFYLYLEKCKAKKRMRFLENEFRDCLLLLSANLRAGYALENAFFETIGELKNLYGDNSFMGKELLNLKKELRFNVPVEDYFEDLGERSGLSSVKRFADILCVAKVNGGNLPKIVQDCAMQISEEIAVRQEISVAVSGKVFEQKIMNVLPFGLYFYVEAGNRGFFQSLYHNISGVFLMTICLFLYLISYFWSEKILQAVGTK